MRKGIELEVVLGDLTTFPCDAIINSANPSLLAGSGLCGILHKKAGKDLESECMALGKCPVGSARLTRAYGLSASGAAWVIHAVAPRWLGGNHHEEELLEQTYKACLKVTYNYEAIYKEQMKCILNQYFEGEAFNEAYLDMEYYVQKHPIKHIAFPAIGVGIYHFPISLSAAIAKKILSTAMIQKEGLEKISIVCNNPEIYKIYKDVFKEELKDGELE